MSYQQNRIRWVSPVFTMFSTDLMNPGINRLFPIQHSWKSVLQFRNRLCLSLASFLFSKERRHGKTRQCYFEPIQYSRRLEGTQLMLIQRFYSYNYWAMFAHSLEKEVRFQNEQGYYLGMELPFPPLAHPCFIRSVFFSLEEIQISKPSRGMDGLIQATFTSVLIYNVS